MFRSTLNLLKSTGKVCAFSTKHVKDSFMRGDSSTYIEDMYNAWIKDPKSVHVSWDSYFRNTVKGVDNAYNGPPNLNPNQRNELSLSDFQAPSAKSAPAASAAPTEEIQQHHQIYSLITSYQTGGHHYAELDPLGLMYSDRTTTFSDRTGESPKSLTSDFISKAQMDRRFQLPSSTFIGGKEKELPLREILRRLELAYCRHIGVEYMYLDSEEEKMFIRQHIETPGAIDLSPEEKKLLLHRLIRAACFELFLARKWSSEKRFGLEGCETMIPALKQIIDTSAENDVKTFIIGIAHRGRLNVLANVCRKPLYQLFTQFAGLQAEDEGSGDVKYHLGTYIKRTNNATHKVITLQVVANPSHLECVDPLVLGKARAEQFFEHDEAGKHTMPILIHGDASFSGQGIVFESLHMSQLPSYTTRGTIHVVINNQVGFTTDPRYSRSSRYCSDVGKVVNAPIFHVNADDPENAMQIAKIAAKYRAKFHKDVVIDLVGYRRNGHNEVDDPMFTQPSMYTKIRALPPILDRYSKQLIEEKVVTQEEVKQLQDGYYKICDEQFLKASKETSMKHSVWLDSPWSGFFEGKDPMKVKATGVPEETLKHIGKVFSSAPPAKLKFVMHKGMDRILKQRKDMIEKRVCDWALGEAFAFGSLLKQKIPVRLSGQDVERGTFAHRHHILHHQTIDKTWFKSLEHLYPDQGHYEVCNSSLCEYGVLGFEVGFSLVNPKMLVIWEAQFGDFCNTAQCIIDQVISSGQKKWVRQSGIVVLLPHGFEGMGPEHSSGRPERFLQMSDDDPDVIPAEGPNFATKQIYDINWIVANCTTPANMFHVLRRQLAFNFRKPLIVFTPKSLLRHPEARSSFDEMLEGTEFERVLPEKGEAAKSPQNVKKLIFCTGKVYYDLTAARAERKLEKDIAIARLEQICPFPYDLVRIECEKYGGAKVEWVQEEPKNAGCYSYCKDRMNTLLKGSRPVGYVGRQCAAAVATGSKAQHKQEVKELIDGSMKL